MCVSGNILHNEQKMASTGPRSSEDNKQMNTKKHTSHYSQIAENQTENFHGNQKKQRNITKRGTKIRVTTGIFQKLQAQGCLGGTVS